MVRFLERFPEIRKKPLETIGEMTTIGMLKENACLQKR